MRDLLDDEGVSRLIEHVIALRLKKGAAWGGFFTITVGSSPGKGKRGSHRISEKRIAHFR